MPPLSHPLCATSPMAADLLALDSKLAALRIKLADIAKEHPVSGSSSSFKMAAANSAAASDARRGPWIMDCLCALLTGRQAGRSSCCCIEQLNETLAHWWPSPPCYPIPATLHLPPAAGGARAAAPSGAARCEAQPACSSGQWRGCRPAVARRHAAPVALHCGGCRCWPQARLRGPP
jgi:hypothetical protein